MQSKSNYFSIMKVTAKIQAIASSEKVGIYSIIFNNQTETEFRDFLKKFRSNAKLHKDYRAIIHALHKILKNGALERYFRFEGKMNDHVSALSVDSKQLRLYCLRISNQILILGNGGVKETRTYNENSELCGYVMDLQIFDKVFYEAIKNGSIQIKINSIENIENANFTL